MSKAQEYVRLAFEKGYRVLDDGTMVSPKGLELSPYPDKDGYLRFSISVGGPKPRNVASHRLAAFQKFGTAMFEEGVEVRHLNGINDDNSLGNIAIGTPHENQMDIPEEARMRRARHAAKSLRKLTEEQVHQLRQDRAGGMTYKQLCAKYGIVKSSVSYLLHGKTYRGA